MSSGMRSHVSSENTVVSIAACDKTSAGTRESEEFAGDEGSELKSSAMTPSSMKISGLRPHLDLRRAVEEDMSPVCCCGINSRIDGSGEGWARCESEDYG